MDELKGWGMLYHANTNQKKGEIAILISNKADLRIRKFFRDKDGHYIMIKGSVIQEDRHLTTEHQNIWSKHW